MKIYQYIILVAIFSTLYYCTKYTKPSDNVIVEFEIQENPKNELITDSIITDF